MADGPGWSIKAVQIDAFPDFGAKTGWGRTSPVKVFVL